MQTTIGLIILLYIKNVAFLFVYKGPVTVYTFIHTYINVYIYIYIICLLKHFLTDNYNYMYT